MTCNGQRRSGARSQESEDRSQKSGVRSQNEREQKANKTSKAKRGQIYFSRIMNSVNDRGEQKKDKQINLSPFCDPVSLRVVA